jgi:hypothetical protein
MTRSVLALAAVLIVSALGSCGDDPPPAAPATRPSGLPELRAQAQRWAGRASLLLERPWMQRLQFRQRLYGRVQALNAFIEEAGAAADPPAQQLIDRGQALINQAQPFDTALALLERVTVTLDQLTGYERLVELNMQPLETRGEAPYRIRVTDYGKQVAEGFSNLDLALRGILDKAGDAKLFEGIATKALADALATATRLSEEVKNAGALAAAAVDRQKMLKLRIEWADGIAAKVGASVPADAVQALADARKVAKEELDAATHEVVERLRNAQPDATEKARQLAAKLDPVIERLTRAFLQIGRSAGVPDPK